LPEQWSTGPSARFEVEKAWGVRTRPSKGLQSGIPERLPLCAISAPAFFLFEYRFSDCIFFSVSDLRCRQQYGSACDIQSKKVQESSEAAELAHELFEDAGFIAYHVLEHAWVYAGSSPEELDEYTLREVLLEIFPCKVTAERDLFEKVAPVMEVFLRWLESEGIPANTAGLVETVRGWADTIVANSMNPQYWGMAKSFTMQARADGVDTQDEQAM